MDTKEKQLSEVSTKELCGALYYLESYIEEYPPRDQPAARERAKEIRAELERRGAS